MVRWGLPRRWLLLRSRSWRANARLLGKGGAGFGGTLIAVATLIAALGPTHEQVGPPVAAHSVATGWFYAAIIVGGIGLLFVILGGIVLAVTGDDLVEPEHGRGLRDTANRLHGQLTSGQVPAYTDQAALAAWAVEHMVEQHFPSVARNVASCREEEVRRQQARDELIQTVFRRGAVEQFGEQEGWRWGAIAQRCEMQLREIVGGEGLNIKADVDGGCVVWTTSVVYWARESADVDGSIDAAAEQLREWVASIRDSPEAVAFREASQAAAAYRLAALHLLDPIVHGQRIRKVRGCRICYPR